MGPAALRTGKHIQAWRVVPPPALEGLGDIGRKIDEAIDPPFALIDAHRPGLQVDRLPGRAHASETRKPQRSMRRNRRRSRRESMTWKKATRSASGIALGKPGGQEAMLPARTGCCGITPSSQRWANTLARILSFGIERRGGQAGRLARGEKRRDILGGRVGEIRPPASRGGLGQGAKEPGQRVRNGPQGGRGIALRGQLGEILEETLLIQRAEGRESGLILRGDRTIHSTIS